MSLNSKDRKFLELAIKTAGENMEDGGGPFGAIITKGENILARAGNRVVPAHDPTAHAEVMAIRMAAEKLGTHDLADCTIYASCEPCPMCLGAIYWAGLRRLVYASDRYSAASAGFRVHDVQFIDCHHVLRGLLRSSASPIKAAGVVLRAL